MSQEFKNRIVTVTDCTDVAANEIRAVLVSELEKLGKADKVEVEPFVLAKEFSLENGAFLVRLMADNYNPDNTTFLVILNPLRTNRTDRARIVGQTQKGFKFVGENTGTLSWLIQDFGVREIYESNKVGLDGKTFISFGGKYVHAPVAARVAAGFDLKTLGSDFDKNRITKLNLKDGTVLHIDNFGVPKIFGGFESSLKEGDLVDIYVNEERKLSAVFTDSMKNLPDDTWAIYRGSSLNNLPEIGKVRSLETARELGVKIGDVVSWKKA